MGKMIFAVDMVSIGLIVSDGNIAMTMKEICDKVDDYERIKGGSFGSEQQDYDRAIVELAVELEIYSYNYEPNKEKGIYNEWYHSNIIFRDLIPEMLKYYYAYFNDSDTWWEKFKGSSELNDEEYRYLKFNKNIYEIKRKRQKALIDFFINFENEVISQYQMKELMVNLGITNRLMDTLFEGEYEPDCESFNEYYLKRETDK